MVALHELSSASRERPVRLGRYDVVGQLGRGGMGTVYEAIDVEHGSRVALKTLKHVDPDRILQFKREFRQVADLRHPNLVSLYELSCDGELWFFTMERLEGQDFVSHFGERSPEHFSSNAAPVPATGSTWAETVTLLGSNASDSRREVYFEEPRQLDADALAQLRSCFVQLVKGLQRVHASGLLHLDIKPSNILIEPDGRVVLLDFGIARAPGTGSAYEDLRGQRDLGPTRRVTGTPAWMSPEQHDGEALGPASDWYAVGLVLYTALTGMRAFSVEGTSALAYAKKNTQPTAPIQLVDVPADLSSLCMDLLHPDPAARPTGEDIEALFESGGERELARPLSRRVVNLVGRHAEREQLQRVLEQVDAGATAIVQIRGPSGIGKSALARDLYEHAARGERLVLRGRCFERETVPYKAFDGMLDELARKLAGRSNDELDRILPPWTQELAQVFPVLGGVRGIAGLLASRPALSSALPASEIRRRAVEALRELFASLGSERRCVVQIDDLQWIDKESCDALTRIMASPAPEGLMLVLGYRGAEIEENQHARACLEQLATIVERKGAPALARVEFRLGPLDADDAGALARRALGTGEEATELLTSIADVAGGSPFFIEELAHLAARQLSRGEAPTIDLKDLARRRLEQLAAEERSLAETLAVAGSPVPVVAAVRVADMDVGSIMSALWSLRRADFVRVNATQGSPTITLRHDRLRESLNECLPPTRKRELHRRLGQALSEQGDGYLFDTVRHLNRAGETLPPAWRVQATELALRAGRRARRGTAFALAFDCFEAALAHLGDDAWTEHYEQALAASEGAAEAAYLSSRWDAVSHHAAAIKTHARTPVEQLGAWEAEIDAYIASTDYLRAIETGIAALEQLGASLPPDPSQAEIGSEFTAAMNALGKLGVEGVAGLPDAGDPVHMASMRVHARITSAAYFGRPNLLPVIACRMVVASVHHGLVPATPYALSILGIVLNTVGMHHEAHAWGQAALALTERFDDRSLDARTAHVVQDLVCVWVVPFQDTLDAMKEVYELGKTLGDVEYAGYAAHAYVHNAMYAGRPLDALLEEAEAITEWMRGHDEFSALPIHEPFEQLLRALTGQTADPACLDGHGFSEVESLAAAEASGSRSAMCLNRVVMALARSWMGRPEDASALYEAARPYLDGMPSVWHTPLFHQYAALAILALDEADRTPLMPHVDTALQTLGALAEAGPMNFAHRVEMVAAEKARVEGDLDAAKAHLDRAIAGARAGAWLNDLGVALGLAACHHELRGDLAAAETARAEAREVLTAWGARAMVERLG